MSETPVLDVADVGVSYGAGFVISDVNLQVRAGEFVGLIGVNGAGKTSLIKTILGLRDADAGKVCVMGKVVSQNHVSPSLAFLPERFEPSWFLTGLEFLRFSSGLYKVKWSDADYELYALRLALDPAALRRRVQTYSKGMRQKLGVLAAVMTKAPLLVLDEPMSGLDPVARTLVKDLLLEVKGQGRTIFVSSHILADMDELCDKVALLHNKKLQFLGTPADLKAQTGDDSLERAFLHFIEVRRAA